jgi:SAM-dependent methyltransferase
LKLLSFGREEWHHVPVDESYDPSVGDNFTARNRATYDRIAQQYAQLQIQPRPPSEDLFTAFESSFIGMVPSSGVIGDLGCGPAFDGARFAARGLHVIGLDLSEGMLSVANEQLPGRLVQGDLRSLPFVSGQLDGIWNVASLLHVGEPDTVKVLKEFRRVLRDRGTLALITALGDGDRFEIVPYAMDEERWFVYRSEDRLLQQAVDVGFSVLSHGQVHGNRLWSTILASAT